MAGANGSQIGTCALEKKQDGDATSRVVGFSNQGFRQDGDTASRIFVFSLSLFFECYRIMDGDPTSRIFGLSLSLFLEYYRTVTQHEAGFSGLACPCFLSTPGRVTLHQGFAGPALI